MNIPTDVQRQVLLRAPYISHDELKDVCRSWKEMMCSPRFYEDRKTYGTSQHLICLIQDVPGLFVYGITVYDPVEKTSERTAPIPCDLVPFVIRFVCVNEKLVMFGLWTLEMTETLEVVVIIYDFVSKKWRRGSNIPTSRIEFASAVSSSKGLIYVAGGEDGRGNSLSTVEAYDVEEDRWEILPPMTHNRQLSEGVYLDGKFMVISGMSFGGVVAVESSAEVFDEATGRWQTLENMWSLRTDIMEQDSGVVCICENLYVIVSKQVMKYDAEKNAWTPVASVPQNL